MNKIVGIGIVVVVIALIIVGAMSFSNDSDTTVTQVGPFTVESSQEYSEEQTANGTNHSIVLTEKLGIKTP